MHVIVYLKTYLQPKTIKIIHKIFQSSKTYQHLKYLHDLAFGRQSRLQRVKNLVLRCGFFLNLITS